MPEMSISQAFCEAGGSRFWPRMSDWNHVRGISRCTAGAAVPGRKTDVTDAQWLQRLHEYGLLRSSFRPERRIAALRDYLRQRERLLEYAASHIQHMQKALMQMNLQLHHVVSDITGATGMRIIRAFVAGERDPVRLAALRASVARGRPRRSDRHWSAMTGRNTSSPGTGRGAV
jgi:hypothetical protein